MERRTEAQKKAEIWALKRDVDLFEAQPRTLAHSMRERVISVSETVWLESFWVSTSLSCSVSGHEAGSMDSYVENSSVAIMAYLTA